MEVEVMMPSPATDFFYSAPTSPTRISAFYNHIWDEKTRTQNSHISTATSSNYGDAEEQLEEIDFAFDFSGQLVEDSLPADELFHGGKIKPLKLHDLNKHVESPRKTIKEVFSPRNRKRDFDPVEEQTRKVTVQENVTEKNSSELVSKYRVSDILLDPEYIEEEEPIKNSASPSRKLLFSSSSFSSSWFKKWKLKDLLLFRSASESRVTDKENLLKKFEPFKKNNEGDVKNSSSRSMDSVRSTSSRRRSRSLISAHELHYTANRAVSEEMKKRTYLPYKQGLLGCLGFYQASSPEVSRRIYSSGSITQG